jgi:hypothetical protein
MPLDIAAPLANPSPRGARALPPLAWEPPPPIDYTAWAEANVVFGSEIPKPGPYDPDLSPVGPPHPGLLRARSSGAGHRARSARRRRSARPRSRRSSSAAAGHGSGPADLLPPDRAERAAVGQDEVEGLRPRHASLAKLFPVRPLARRRQLAAVPGAHRRPRLAAELGRQLGVALSQISAPRQVQDDLAKWEPLPAGRSRGPGRQPLEAFAVGEDLQGRHAALKPGCRMTPTTCARPRASSMCRARTAATPAAHLGEPEAVDRRARGSPQGRPSRRKTSRPCTSPASAAARDRGASPPRR